MKKFYIYLAVIVSGASALAIEILGTRLLAPFYGSSIYLWSALIGVALAALSLGYALGGRSADRAPSFQTFSAIIGLAGLWISFIPALRAPALALTESLGLRTAVLLTATVLFFPPLTLLAMIVLGRFTPHRFIVARHQFPAILEYLVVVDPLGGLRNPTNLSDSDGYR